MPMQINSSMPVLESTGHFPIEKINELSAFDSHVVGIIHRIGREWVRPWAFGVRKVVQLFKAHQKITALMLGILTIVTMPLALPGLLIRTVTIHFFQKSLTFSSALKLTEMESNKEQFSIMTWNTALGPGFMTEANELKGSSERIEGIVAKICQEKPDIVCMQEVFDLDAAEDLAQNLRKQGYDCIYNVNPHATRLPSGLFVAVAQSKEVKFHIEAASCWRFNNLQGVDALSSKGLMGIKMRLETKNKAPMLLHLFNTHLQSSYADSSYAEIRKEQMQAIAKTMQDWAKKEETEEKSYSILCGDLNFSNHPPEESDIPNEYNDQMEVLHKDQFNPLHVLQHIKNPGTLHSPKEHGATVDYILLDHDLGMDDVKARVLPLKNFESDHLPVITEVSLRQTPKTSSPTFNV